MWKLCSADTEDAFRIISDALESDDPNHTAANPMLLTEQSDEIENGFDLQ